MRIVRWQSDERVDVPDITALSHLVLGEFRRLVRSLFQGQNRFAVRGFAVEPEVGPTARVVVKMTPSGVTEGALLGAEDTGLLVDYGQLVGGRDSNNDLEGNAQQIIDFTGIAVGNYYIEARFTYTDGANDTSRFWTSPAGPETTAAMDTRRLPGWEAQRVAAPTGDEWVVLALVVWDGVSIPGGSISDKRDFLIEGVSPFQGDSQEDGFTGAADFNRSSSRATLGLQEVIPAIRGLARQIQDLKGQDASGKWNWWNRIFQPLGVGVALGPGAKQTKNLRSVDTVTYTIGDGTTTWGDFNGIVGLEKALQFIGSGATLPNRFILVLKSEMPGGFEWLITKSCNLNGRSVEIIGGTTKAGGSQEDRARAVILVTYSGTSAAITMGGAIGQLTMRNIQMYIEEPLSTAVPLIEMNADGGGSANLVLDDCAIYGYEAASTRPTISAPASNLYISRCDIKGTVSLFSANSASVRPGRVENTRFSEAAIRLNRFIGAGGVDAVPVSDLVFHGCRFNGMTTVFGGTATNGGMVRLIGGDRVTFERCYFKYVNDEDAIKLSHNSIGGIDYACHEIVVRDCTFEVSDGTHTAGSGQNGSVGTGYGVFVHGDATVAGQYTSDILVENCLMKGTQRDGGAVYAFDSARVSVRKLTARRIIVDTVNAAPKRCQGLVFFDGFTTDACCDGLIENCDLGQFDANGGTTLRLCCIRLEKTARVKIRGCLIDGRDVATLITNLHSTEAGGLLITGSLNTHTLVEGCHFIGWTANASSLPTCVVFDDAASHLRFSHNTFEDVVGYAIQARAASAPTVFGCFFEHNNFVEVTAGMFGISMANMTAGGRHQYIGNKGHGLTTLIDLGPDPGFVLIGNNDAGADIRKPAAGAGIGFDRSDEEVNLVSAFTNY